MFTKLDRDEVLIVPYKCCRLSARSPQGQIKGGAKICHGGPLLQETSSSDRNLQRHTKCYDLEACGKKCSTRFDVFLDLNIFAYFNAIFIDFYAVKSFIYIYFV